MASFNKAKKRAWSGVRAQNGGKDLRPDISVARAGESATNAGFTVGLFKRLKQDGVGGWRGTEVSWGSGLGMGRVAHHELECSVMQALRYKP